VGIGRSPWASCQAAGPGSCQSSSAGITRMWSVGDRQQFGDSLYSAPHGTLTAEVEPLGVGPPAMTYILPFTISAPRPVARRWHRSKRAPVIGLGIVDFDLIVSSGWCFAAHDDNSLIEDCRRNAAPGRGGCSPFPAIGQGIIRLVG
jgi:hypothetical protein